MKCVGGWAIRVVAVLLSVFVWCQWLLVLCAEVGGAWHYLGVGRVSALYLSV